MAKGSDRSASNRSSALAQGRWIGRQGSVQRPLTLEFALSLSYPPRLANEYEASGDFKLYLIDSMALRVPDPRRARRRRLISKGRSNLERNQGVHTFCAPDRESRPVLLGLPAVRAHAAPQAVYNSTVFNEPQVGLGDKVKLHPR